MTTFPPIFRHIRHVQRHVKVLKVLARHGFAELAQQLKLDTLVERGRAILGAAHKGGVEHIPRAQRVRMVLEELGPTFVKLGQVLSTRPDLVPQEWADEFKKLQDDVPGVDYEVIHATLSAEFPGQLRRLFRSIQKKPLAAASMAQVHRARLRDGTRIVLKVLRPGIREITTTDMEILRALAEVAESHFSNLGYSPTEVVSEFAKELKKEVDLTYEGRSTERLRNFFEGDPDIIFPRVYWEASTSNVLAMDEIRGILLSRLHDGVLSQEDRRRLVENGARAVFRQCLELGFFHADPHPGNLFALPGGKIAFIDCGMTGQIEMRTSQQLADLVRGVVQGDLDQVVAVAGALADVPQDKLEDPALRADVQSIVSEFQGTPLERLNLGRVLQDFFHALRTHQVRLPANMVLLIKALTTIESVGKDLDPSFEMVTFVRPFLERLVSKRYGLSAIRSRLRRSLLQYVELVEDLPSEIRPVLAQLRRNRFTFNLEHRGLTRLTHTIEHASRNISFALIIAAMLVGSSILVLAARQPGLAGLTAIGVAGFVAAAILVVVMIVTNRRYRGD
jgi:ubiquinone biosynthesis protein